MRQSDVDFRPGIVLEDKLKERNPEHPGEMARRDLNRFYALIDYGLLNIDITVEEACMICEALNGTLFDYRASVIDTLRIGIADYFNYNPYDSLGNNRSTEVVTLVEKISKYDMIQCAAIVDASERFWMQSEEGNDHITVLKRLFKIEEKNS